MCGRLAVGGLAARNRSGSIAPPFLIDTAVLSLGRAARVYGARLVSGPAGAEGRPVGRQRGVPRSGGVASPPAGDASAAPGRAAGDPAPIDPTLQPARVGL